MPKDESYLYMHQNKKKINILIPIKNPVGGIRTYLKYTHGNLDRNVYEFSFLIDSSEWLKRIRDSFSGFQVKVFCPKRQRSNVSMLLSIFFLLMRNKYQLIHSQGLTAGMMSTIANLLFGRPHVLTLHQVFGQGYSIDQFFEKYARLKKYIIQVMLSRADIIQCVSNDAKENLLEFFPGLLRSSEKIIAIRNGIDIEVFDIFRNVDTKPFEKNEDKFYIGFLGRYMPHKGFQYVIDAVDVIVNEFKEKDIKVISVGDSSGFFNMYKREINKRSLDQYFEFLDFIENVAPVLKHIDLLLMPSLAEACGLLAMEALVCGTPIVAFSCIGLREVLQNTPARMVPVGDLKRLVQEIIDTKNSYPGTKMEFDNCIAQARERYDVKTAAAKLDELFTKLVKT